MPSGPGRQHNAFVIETGHQHVDAVADDAKDILRWHFAVGEHQFGRIGAAHAELVELLRRRKALHRLLDQERGDAARTGGAVGLGVDHQRIGHGTVGDPHLGAVEHIAVADLVGPRRHRHHIGAGARFRHRQRADMHAGYQLRQIFALLLGRAVAADLIDAEIGMRAVGQAHRCRGARHLLHGDTVRQVAKAGAAIFLIDRNAVQAERPHFGPEVARKTLLRSISSARGAILSCANPLTDLRSMSTSSPRPKSKPAQLLGIIAAASAEFLSARHSIA